MKKELSKIKKAITICITAVILAAASPITTAGQTMQAITQIPGVLSDAEINTILTSTQWIIATDGNAMNAEGSFFLFFNEEASAWNLLWRNANGEFALQSLTSDQSYLAENILGVQQERPALPSQPLVGTWAAVSIEGDARFVAYTQRALNVIRHSPSAYATVLRYIGIIRQGDASGMWAWLEPPTFVVGTATYTASTSWYASAILHDAIHSKQYHNHLARYGYVPSEVWTGYYAEMEALEIQTEFLRLIGAPAHEIRWAESLIGEVWWDGTPWW